MRAEIDELYEQANQVDLSKWAINCAKRVLPLAEFEKTDLLFVEKGFRIVELWQIGKASVHEVRQAGFKIHELARHCTSEIGICALRTVGQAVGIGHMREHAMVCSDYAIKTLQLAFPDQIDKISQERQWQLSELKKYT